MKDQISYKHFNLISTKPLVFLILLQLLSVSVHSQNFYWYCQISGGGSPSRFDCLGKNYPSAYSVCENMLSERGEEDFTNFTWGPVSDVSEILVTNLNVGNARCSNYHHYAGTTGFPPAQFRLNTIIYRAGGGCPAGTDYIQSGASCLSGEIADAASFFEETGNLGKSEICPNPSNPINLKTGNKYQEELDYQSPVSPNGSSFKRYYNSNTTQLQSGSLGNHWRGSYDKRVLTYIDSTNSTESYPVWITVVYRNDGKGLSFSNSDGNWYSETHQDIKLTELKDADNIRSGWEFTDADDNTETYDKNGKLLSITDRAGFTQTLEYDLALASGSGDDNPETLDSVTGPFGRTLHFQYHSATSTAYDGLLWKMIDPDGNEYIYDYDIDGNLEYVTYPSNSPISVARQYIYDDPNGSHLLTGIIDERGIRSHSWGYDTQGRAISSEHGASGSGIDRYDLVFNGNGTTTLTSPTKQQQTYHFETHNYTHKVSQITGGQCTSCGGTTQSTAYDGNGHVDTKTDFRGTITDYTINAEGLEEQRIEAVGTPVERTIATTWDATFRLPLSITEPGKMTTFTYDTSGRVLTRTIEDTITSDIRANTYTYYEASDFGGNASDPRIGLLKTIDGPRIDLTDITTYEYDVEGNLIKVTNALGHETRITSYDGNGRPLTILDTNNTETTFVYDPRGRLLSRTVDGQTTSLEYDSVGNITKTMLPNGAYMMNTYDAARRLTEIEDNLGNTITYTLDNLGNRTQEDTKDINGTLRRAMSRAYNSLNRLIETIGGEGQVTTLGYDANGNQTSISLDPTGLNQVTTQSFDSLNRLTKTTDASLGATDYTYDGRDNLTSIKDAEGLTTTYFYDGLDNLEQQISPDTNTTTYTHDESGNVKTQTDARGVVTTYTYDALNRLISKTYPGTGNPQNVTYTYDTGKGCANGTGRLCEMTDESGITRYSYDARGNVINKTTIRDSITQTISYAYNGADQITQITYPSGRVVNYFRSPIGNISKIDLTEGSVTQNLVDNFFYRPYGPVIQYDRFFSGGPASVIEFMNYDLDYRTLGKYTHANGFVSLYGMMKIDEYQYDNANNIKNITHYGSINGITSSYPFGFQDSFQYDALNRLHNSSHWSGQFNYSYDAIGNRLTKTENSTTDTYNYTNTSHRLDAVNTQTYTYDDNGNTINYSTHNYVYGDNNRLSQVDSNIFYIYNDQSQRTKKIVNGAVTYYHYDEQGLLIAESNSAGIVQKEYIYFGNELMNYIENGNLYSVQTDHLGTPGVMTDILGNPVWVATYTPFGKATVDSASTATLNLRMPGQYFDAETGCHYNWHRYYCPQIGRYITSDPIGLEGGFNTYLYANANPINRIDTNGLFDINLAESISVGISGVLPLSPSGLGTGGSFGVTLRKCCTDQNTIANELFVSGGVGPGAGGVISLSSAPSGNIGIVGTAKLPECLDPTLFPIDLGPSITFKGGIGVGPSVGASRDGVVIGASIQAGSGILALPQESALVILQTETVQPCDCEE